MIKELSLLADALLAIYNEFVELSDDYTISPEELRDEIKSLCGSIIDEAEKLKKLDY